MKFRKHITEHTVVAITEDRAVLKCSEDGRESVLQTGDKLSSSYSVEVADTDFEAVSLLRVLGFREVK